MAHFLIAESQNNVANRCIGSGGKADGSKDEDEHVFSQMQTAHVGPESDQIQQWREDERLLMQ